jgi:glycerol-3-phosphate dehydrogenase
MVISELNAEKHEFRAKVIVNATGVWQADFDGRAQKTRHRGSKGVHIAVARERVGNREAVTMISPVDGRVMFCLPADTQTIIGTTDTWTDDAPETVHASAGDVDYLLRSANAYFPDARLTSNDVVSAWAGIRPLAGGQPNNPSAASREHSIVADDSGIIHVTGGKLTTYRSMAAEIVDRAQEALGRQPTPSGTESAELPGADRDREIARLQQEDSRLGSQLVDGLAYTGAHLVYGVTSEKAQTLSDLLIRRTHLAFETHDHGRSVAPRVADIVAPLLEWTVQTKSARIREFEAHVGHIFAITH